MKPKIIMKKFDYIKNNTSYQKPIIIAGPCSVESHDVMDQTGSFLKSLGIEYLRGGAYKPRTSPYSFQGLGIEGIDILKDIRDRYHLKIVTEILDIRDVEEVLDAVDVIQIGSRNMYNYPLLKEVGRTDKTVLLKRGMSATIEEWLNAAEYIALEGNTDIILCERGIRTYEDYTRNTFDINSIPVVKQRTNLKILGDPSHGTGRRELIEPIGLAAVAAGADGLIIELHPDPENAVSDGFQSLAFDQFERIYKKIIRLYQFMNGLNNQ